MNTEIKVRVETVYGKKTIYPANPQAERLAALAGTKTLTKDTLERALIMGFTIVEDNAPRLQRVVPYYACEHGIPGGCRKDNPYLLSGDELARAEAATKAGR